MRIGLISDTHGLLRPQALAALTGSDLIIHAGDIETGGAGASAILEALRQIAPTFAVRGNGDTGGWSRTLPQSHTVRAGGLDIYVTHRCEDLPAELAGRGIAAAVFGHSHKPSIEWRGGMLLCNPGSAGPRRFKLPVTLATLDILGSELRPQIVPLL